MLASIIEGISTFQIILFVVGLLLLIVEMFLPGFGIAGGSGVVLLVIAIVLTAKNATQAAVMVLILLALIALVLFVILRSAKKGKLSKTLILNSAARSTEGYRATADLSDLLGNVGVALTVLRPPWTGEFATGALMWLLKVCTSIKEPQSRLSASKAAELLLNLWKNKLTVLM